MENQEVERARTSDALDYATFHPSASRTDIGVRGVQFHREK
jgi:hypothetical protein